MHKQSTSPRTPRRASRHAPERGVASVARAAVPAARETEREAQMNKHVAPHELGQGAPAVTAVATPQAIRHDRRIVHLISKRRESAAMFEANPNDDDDVGDLNAYKDASHALALVRPMTSGGAIAMLEEIARIASEADDGDIGDEAALIESMAYAVLHFVRHLAFAAREAGSGHQDDDEGQQAPLPSRPATSESAARASTADSLTLDLFARWAEARAQARLQIAKDDLANCFGTRPDDGRPAGASSFLETMRDEQDVIAGTSPETSYEAVLQLGVAIEILKERDVDPESIYAAGPVTKIVWQVAEALGYLPPATRLGA